MGIHGLTIGKKPSLLYSPTIGKIRKGGEKTDQRKPGPDLDYFRVTFSANYEGRGLEQEFEAVYGDKPTSLNVFVYGANADDAFPTWYEEWNAATLLHRCDGEHQVRHYNTQKNRYIDDPVACQKPGDKGCDTCKRVGRLCVILPDFGMRTGISGVFTFETHSVHDIIAIYSMLISAERVNQNRFHKSDLATYGAFYGVPFVLERGKKKISTPNGNGRAMREKSLVTLTYAPAYTQFALQAQGRALELESGDYLALPERAESAHETADEIEDVEGDVVDDDEPPVSRHFADDVTKFNAVVDQIKARIQMSDFTAFLKALNFADRYDLPEDANVAKAVIKTRIAQLSGNRNLPDFVEPPFRLLMTKAVYRKLSRGARFEMSGAIDPLYFFGHRAEFCEAVGWKGDPESIEDGAEISFDAFGFDWERTDTYYKALLPVTQRELL